MKKLSITIFFITLSNLHAQVPGYLGKRFSIGFNVGIVNSGQLNLFNYLTEFRERRVTYDGTKVPVINLDLRPCLQAEYVLSRRVALSLGYQQYKFGLTYEEDNNSNNIIHYSNADCNAIKVGICLSKKKYIMPHGKYKGFYLSRIATTVNKFEDNKRTEQTAYVHYNISYDLGTRKIFFDRLVLDYSYGFGLTFNFKGDQENFQLALSHNQLDYIHVNVGLKYLLF